MLRGYHLADVITLCNAAAGVGALFAALRAAETHDAFSWFLGALLLPVGFLCDCLDGRVARWRGSHSAMGRELDSLADIISFGVAPAVLAAAAGLDGGWDRAILALFVLAGVSRLARYNVSAEQLQAGGEKVRFFEGTPITVSLLLVGLLTALRFTGHVGDALPLGALRAGPFVVHPVVGLFFVTSCLMISKTIRIPKP